MLTGIGSFILRFGMLILHYERYLNAIFEYWMVLKLGDRKCRRNTVFMISFKPLIATHGPGSPPIYNRTVDSESPASKMVGRICILNISVQAIPGKM